MNDIRTFTSSTRHAWRTTAHYALRATSTPSALSRHDAAKRVMAESAPISNMARWYLRSRATSCASAGRMPWTGAYPVFCSTRSCSAPKALCSRKPTIRSSITGRTRLCTFPSLRLVSAGLELLLDYCVRFYERQFACRTDIDGEYMEKLDKTLSQYFSLCGQKSVEGGISKVESALSSLSPAYLNDFVRAETGKTLAEYIRIRMMEYIKKRVHKEGCPLEQVAGEFGFYQPRLLALLYRQVFGCQPEHYLLTPDYKLN